MIYRYTFKLVGDGNHVLKINWYKVWCLQKMINCEKDKSFKQLEVTKWKKKNQTYKLTKTFRS